MSFGYSHQSGIGLVFDLDDHDERDVIFNLIKKANDGDDDVNDYLDDTAFDLNNLTCYWFTDLPPYSSYGSLITGHSREVSDVVIIEPNVHYNTPFVTPEVKSEQELVDHFRKELGDLIDDSFDLSPYLRNYDCYFVWD